MDVFDKRIFIQSIIMLLQFTQSSSQNSTAPPVFEKAIYNGTCAEGTPIDRVVMSVSATYASQEPGNEVEYFMENNPWFKINNTGFIKVKSLIDAENSDVKRVETYLVVAVDNGTEPRSATAAVSIQIEDVNEHRPKFTDTLIEATMYDGDGNGTVLYHLNATDADRDAALIFDLPIPRSYLHLDSDTGLLTLNDTIHLEEVKKLENGRTRFDILARVSDGFFRNIAAIRVILEDKNHFAPNFTRSVIEVSVDEGLEEGYLTRFQATDDQELPIQNVFYSFPQNNTPDYLKINKTSGEITLVKSLDRESLANSTFEQLVLAEDDGKPGPVMTSTATLVITVNDVNDNTPVFDVDSFNLTLSSTFKAGEEFSLPPASDVDTGENGVVAYQLSKNADQYFRLKPDTGVLTTTVNCNNNCSQKTNKPWMTIKVYAFNRDSPHLNDSLRVDVFLEMEIAETTTTITTYSNNTGTTPKKEDTNVPVTCWIVGGSLLALILIAILIIICFCRRKKSKSKKLKVSNSET